MTNVRDFESILETYTIEEILEMNDLTVADAIEILYNERFINYLPDPEPVTVERQWDDILAQEALDEL